MAFDSTSTPRLNRRRLLGSGLAIGAGAAAGQALIGSSRAAAATTTEAAASKAATVTSTTAPTISSLVSDYPFYIAHRGGGRDWPELTGYAYGESAKLPDLQAVEISTAITRDGVLVCSHDPNTLSATGHDAVIGDVDWSDISDLTVTGKYTLDPSQPARPITRYSQVIYPYMSRFVVFAEPKTSAAAPNLFWNLRELGQPERVVWKQPIDSALFAAAKKAGFSTWGYVLNEPWHLGANLERYAASEYIDSLGAPLSESDDFIKAIVDAATKNNKQTIAWAVSTAADRDRALRLGCQGLMTSDIRGLLGTGYGDPLNTY